MSIQNSYANATASHKDFKIGQVANTLPCKIESGVLTIPTSQTSNTTLPFGRACRWTGSQTNNDEYSVNTGSARKPIGTIKTTATGTSISITLDPGRERPTAGQTLVIGANSVVISTVGATDVYTVSPSVSVTAGDDVTLLHGGPTYFAGVALANRVLPADNAPDADNYNASDHVSIGAEGDFVVEVDGAVAYGNGAGVNISSGNDYGKFTKTTEGTNVIGIPGATFVSASQSINGKTLAILRLPKQST